MYIISILLGVIILYEIKFHYPDGDDFFTKRDTTVIKGICAILIMSHHIVQQTQYTFPINMYARIGCLVCAIFFFLSGYGIYCSYTNNKKKFVKSMRQRILKLAIPLYLAEVINMMLHLINGDKIFYTFENGNLFGNWFFYVIVIEYLMFTAIFCFWKIDSGYKCIILFVITFMLNYILWKLGWQGWWWNSSLTFSMGVLVAQYKTKILKNISWKLMCFLISFSVIIYSILRWVNVNYSEFNNIYFLTETLAPMFFALFVVMVLGFVRISSNFLYFVGLFSYEIFLFHYIFMYVFRGIVYVNSDAFFSLCVVTFTLVFSAMFYRLKKNIM